MCLRDSSVSSILSNSTMIIVVNHEQKKVKDKIDEFTSFRNYVTYNIHIM